MFLLPIAYYRDFRECRKVSKMLRWLLIIDEGDPITSWGRMTKISETTQDCKGQILKNTAMRRIKNRKKKVQLLLFWLLSLLWKVTCKQKQLTQSHQVHIRSYEIDVVDAEKVIPTHARVSYTLLDNTQQFLADSTRVKFKDLKGLKA